MSSSNSSSSNSSSCEEEDKVKIHSKVDNKGESINDDEKPEIQHLDLKKQEPREKEEDQQQDNNKRPPDASKPPPAAASNDVANTTSEVDQLVQAVEKIHIVEEEEQQKVFPESLVKVARWIQNGTCQNILVLTGAGVSVAAGIPDFRTPGTGLYDNLQAYNLPYPEAVFDLQFYRSNPQPFCALAKEIWPTGQRHAPTLTHCFVALLAERHLLLRNYSQNIDGLEYLCHIPADLLVECHGHFRSASCIQCGRPAKAQDVQDTILNGNNDNNNNDNDDDGNNNGNVPICQYCHSYVKPDIVFFGQGLPERFHRLLRRDLMTADACLILGTSLQVAPVSLIPDMVTSRCKRILVNREFVGNLELVDDNDNDDDHCRDVFCEGDCDDNILQLAQLLGWEDELRAKHRQAQASLLPKQQEDKEESTTTEA